MFQVATIGLWDAARAFTPGRASFGVFAEKCISRDLLDHVDAANAEKQQILNDALSLEEMAEYEEAAA